MCKGLFVHTTIFVKKISQILLLLSVLLTISSLAIISQAFAVSVVLDYNSSYALPGPVPIIATIYSSQPFNGTVRATNLQSFLGLAPVSFTDGSFVINDSSSFKTQVLLSLSASDVGSFTTNLAVTNDTTSNSQVVANVQLSSSFYYDAPPQVISSKLITNNLNSSTVLVQFETDIPSACKFDYAPTTYDQAVFSLYVSSQSNTIHTYTLNNVKQKQYSFYVLCKAISSQKVMTDPFIYTFNISKNPPTIISYQPSIVNGGTGLQLSLQTDVPSECKYDLTDTDYSSMGTFFDYVFGTNHQTLIPLSASPIQVFVRCTDSANNIMQSSYVVNYAKQSTPSASIDVSDYIAGNYLTDGIHTITLSATPRLVSPPSFSISYIMGDGIKTVKIPLALEPGTDTSSSQIYTGSLQILPNEFSGVAYFDFDGVDMLGNHGTQLTGETSLIVVSSNPDPVQNVVAKQLSPEYTGGSGVELDVTWTNAPDPYFDHYEVQKFYASDTSTILSTTSTASENIHDRDLINGKTYVYGIVAVNKALKKSAPVYSSPITLSADGTTATTTSPQTNGNQQTGSTYVMPQYLSANLLAIQGRLDNLLASFKSANSSPLFPLVGATDKNTKVIDLLDSTLTNSRKTIFTSNQAVADHISALLNVETAAKQQYITSVRIIESSSEKQVLSKDDYTSLFSEYLAAKRWDGSASDFDFVLTATQGWMSKLSITKHVSLMGVTYYNGAQDVKTYISKDIVGEIPPQSQIYEYMGSQTAQAQLNNPDYQRLVKFMVTTSADNISYYFDGSLQTNQTADFKTIFFPENPFDSQQSTTGNFFATNFSLGSTLYYILGFVAILFLGVYYRTGSATSLFDTTTFSNMQSYFKDAFSALSSTKNLFSRKKKNLNQTAGNNKSGSDSLADSKATSSSDAVSAAVANKVPVISGDAQYLLDLIANGSSSQALKALAAAHAAQMHKSNAMGSNSEYDEKGKNNNNSNADVDLKAHFSDFSAMQTLKEVTQPSSQNENSKLSAKNDKTFATQSTTQTHSLSDVTLDPKEILTFRPSQRTSQKITKATDVSVVSNTNSKNGNLVRVPTKDAQTNAQSLGEIPLSIKKYHAPANLSFITADGKRINTLLELAFELSQMREDVFAHHVNSSKHDFAIWINDVFGLSKHAWVLKEIKDRNALAQAIFMMVEGGMSNEKNNEYDDEK